MANHPEELRFDFTEPASEEDEEPVSEVELVTKTTTKATVVSAGEELVARIDRLRVTAGRTRPHVERPAPPRDAEDPHAQDADAALSIAGFYERVRRALQDEFAGEVWVVGEIRGLREARG